MQTSSYAPHAVAGGGCGRSSAISRKISSNRCRGMATSAIWKAILRGHRFACDGQVQTCELSVAWRTYCHSESEPIATRSPDVMTVEQVDTKLVRNLVAQSQLRAHS